MALASALPAGSAPPAAARIQEYLIPRAGNFPHDPAVSPEGIVWYTDQSNSYIGRLDPASDAITDYPTPNSGPYGITIGPDDRIWYNEASSSLMVAFDPRTEAMQTVAIPTPGCVVRHIVTDLPRRRIWPALSGTGRIGRIDL